MQTSSTFLTQGETTSDFGVIQVYQVLEAFAHLWGAMNSQCWQEQSHACKEAHSKKCDWIFLGL